VQTIQDLFCGSKCFRQFCVKCMPHGLRQLVAARDLGICEWCGLDGQQLLERLQALTSSSDRRQLLEVQAPQMLEIGAARLGKLLSTPAMQYIWHCDHEVAVFEGGGLCSQSNARTLCLACHHKQTSHQAAMRAHKRGLKRFEEEEEGEQVPARSFAEVPWDSEGEDDVWLDPGAKSRRKKRATRPPPPPPPPPPPLLPLPRQGLLSSRAAPAPPPASGATGAAAAAAKRKREEDDTSEEPGTPARRRLAPPTTPSTPGAPSSIASDPWSPPPVKFR
jgi:hypothetical protein